MAAWRKAFQKAFACQHLDLGQSFQTESHAESLSQSDARPASARDSTSPAG